MRTEKERLYNRVDSYRDVLEIPLNQPVCIIDTLNLNTRFDIEYCNFRTPGLCGVAMVGEKTDTIILNSNRTPAEQNFDCGHELIHLIVHRNLQDNFNCFTKAKPQQNSFCEWQANEGAAQLLVPYQDFIPRFTNLLNDNVISIQSILAEYYHVTIQVINIRMNSLAYEIDQYQEGTDLDKIELLSRKQRKQRGITSTRYEARCDFMCV